MKIKHIVKLSPRLDFKQSSLVVMEFMRLRALHYGIAIEFVHESSQMAVDLDKFDVLVKSNIFDAFSDYDELNRIIAVYGTTNWGAIDTVGFIPGTTFTDIVRIKPSDGAEKFTYISEMQLKHNLQCNIFKYKRLKVFLGLIQKIPLIHEMSVEQFVTKLETKEIFHFVLSFADESILVEELKKCPYCQSSHTQKLYSNSSQPFLGFVTSKISFYERCNNCELVYLNPVPRREDISRLYDDFDKQDFVVSTNFPYDEDGLRGQFVKKLDHPLDCKSLDMGGGIGKYSQFVKKTFPHWSVTHSDFEIKRNEELEQFGIKTRSLDFTSDPIGKEEYDIITMWEVIEHIHYSKLDFVFDNIANALSPNGLFVFSTPNFDSPACQFLDFYAACPPFHTFVFSEKWLSRYFAKHPKLKVKKIGYCSDFFDDLNGWMDYAMKTCGNSSDIAAAEFIKELGRAGISNKASIAESLRGSEVIFCLERR